MHLVSIETITERMDCIYNMYVIAQVIYAILATVYLLLCVLLKKIFCTREESLVGKTVLVTKAGHGLGKEIAKQFSREGAFVICWDEQYRTCMDTVYDIRHAGGSAIGFRCNDADAAEVVRTVTATMKRAEHIDILVNNADMHSNPPPTCWDEAELRQTFDKDLFSHFWVINAVLPFMRSINKGHIIAVTPIYELPSLLHDVSRTACRFAVTGMMEALLQQIHRTPGNKLRTTCVHPYCPQPKGTTSRQLKFRIIPRSTEKMAKEILKGIKSGQQVFSVPKKFFWYSNILRCLPQEVERFWTNFIYRNTLAEEDPRISERTQFNLVPHREHSHVKDRLFIEKRGERIMKNPLTLLQKTDPVWKRAKLENPSEEMPIIFYSKDKWNLVIQEKSKNSLRYPSSLDIPGTSYSPQYKDSLIIDFTSDSVCTLDIDQSQESVASERLEPSWLTKITESLIYSDWLSQLYEPFSTIVLPASRHYLTPWSLKLDKLFCSRSRVHQQSIISLANQNIAQKMMESSSSRLESDPANKRIFSKQRTVTFIESEVQINVIHLNDNEEHRLDGNFNVESLPGNPALCYPSSSPNDLFMTPLQSPNGNFNVESLPGNPALCYPSSSPNDLFMTPLQSPISLPQNASSKLLGYYFTPDQSNNSITSNLQLLQNEENKTENGNIIPKTHTFTTADSNDRNDYVPGKKD